MRESKIEAYFVRRAKELGGEVRKVQWIGRNAAPDRVLMLPKREVREQDPVLGTDFCVQSRPARTVWVELKAPGEKPRPDQLREHQRMRAAGQHVEVVDTLEGVDALLAVL